MNGNAIIALLGLLLAGTAATAATTPAEPGQKAVLVTGASTGIGRKITERIAADGYFVYAGARKEKDLLELDAIESAIGKTAAERLGMTTPLADRSQYPEPDDVAAAVLHSLSDAKPKRRYMVVPVQAEAEATIRKAIQELVQLNEQHPFSYDRKALVEMLDAELALSQGSR